MKLNIKIDNSSLTEIKKEEWDKSVKLILKCGRH